MNRLTQFQSIKVLLLVLNIDLLKLSKLKIQKYTNLNRSIIYIYMYKNNNIHMIYSIKL